MSDAHQIGTASRTGRLISLSGLPSPVPFALGQRDVDRLAVEVDDLATDDPPHDLDRLLDARHRLLVGHAVEALDDLRP